MSDAHEEAENARQLDGTIYADSYDRQRHRGSMQAIADEVHRPFARLPNCTKTC